MNDHISSRENQGNQIASEARCLQSLGFQVVPLARSSNRYRKEYERVAHIPDERLDGVFANQDLGIVLGQRSPRAKVSDGYYNPFKPGVPNYPFVIECYTAEALVDMMYRLGDRVVWVSRWGSRYLVWLTSPSGRPSSYESADCRFILDGVVPVPPSVDELGRRSEWLLRDADLPGSIGEEYLCGLFPGVEVHYKYEPFSPGLPDDFIHELIPYYLGWMERYNWPRQQRAYVMWLLIALLRRANFESPDCFRASCRELELLSGLAIGTVRRHLSTLKDLQLLKQLSADGRAASIFRLFKLPRRKAHIQLNQTAYYLWAFQGHDAFRPDAVNVSGAVLYATLLAHPEIRTMKPLVEKTGLSTPTVRSVTRSLQEAQLLKIRNGLLLPEPYDVLRLDAVADYYGSSGTSERIKARQDMERLAFADWRRQAGALSPLAIS